ncbi:MAG: ferric iron uptake transcriptional regulator [Granulosicoccus sp.]
MASSRSTVNQDLKDAGLKVTMPRVSILQILEKADPHHLSAEDIYKSLIEAEAEIGLATVYRVLTQLESAGLVTRHHFDGGQALFELDTGDNHDHIVCMNTGRVAEFKDEIIESRLAEIARDLGYKLTDHEIVLYGEYKSTVTEKRREKVRSNLLND